MQGNKIIKSETLLFNLDNRVKKLLNKFQLLNLKTEFNQYKCRKAHKLTERQVLLKDKTSKVYYNKKIIKMLHYKVNNNQSYRDKLNQFKLKFNKFKVKFSLKFNLFKPKFSLFPLKFNLFKLKFNLFKLWSNKLLHFNHNLIKLMSFKKKEK